MPRSDPPRQARQPLGDASGRAVGERLSEYFDFERWPEKADKKVTRHELAIWLERYALAQRQLRWRSRLWRFLKAKLGSGPVVNVETPTTEAAP